MTTSAHTPHCRISHRARQYSISAASSPRALPWRESRWGLASPPLVVSRGCPEGAGPPPNVSSVGRGGAKPAPEPWRLRRGEVKRLERRRGNPPSGCFSPLCYFLLFCQHKRGESKSPAHVWRKLTNPRRVKAQTFSTTPQRSSRKARCSRYRPREPPWAGG